MNIFKTFISFILIFISCSENSKNFCDQSICSKPLFCNNKLNKCETLCENTECENNQYCDFKTGDCIYKGESENSKTLCSDGIDNDKDQYIDCEDPDCFHFFPIFCDIEIENSEQLCSDNIDNDNNGFIDCEDINCKNLNICNKKLFLIKTIFGEIIKGELVAIFNKDRWWDRENGIIYGIFQYENFNPNYQEDRSFKFINSDIIKEIEEINWEKNIKSYNQFLEKNGIIFNKTFINNYPVYIYTADEGYHLEENGYGDNAFDIVLTDKKGSRGVNDLSNNKDYYIWEKNVYSPTNSFVIEVEKGHKDNIPGDYEENSISNYIGFHIIGSFYLYILHFKYGSIPDEIEENRFITFGQYLGKVGNSGVSLEPHLHIALLWWDYERERYWSVPTLLTSIYTTNSPQIEFKYVDYFTPKSGFWIKDKDENDFLDY